MTAVIAGRGGCRYRETVATLTNAARVAAALAKPGDGYVAGLDDACETIREESLEAARHLAMFLNRVRDLRLDELQELHAETFERGRCAADPVAELACVLTSSADAGTVLDAIVSALPRLDSDRNPFACAVRALACLLLAGADRAEH